MHIPDGFLNDETNTSLFGAAFIGLFHALRHVRTKIFEKVPVLKAKLATFPSTNNLNINLQNKISEMGKEKIWRMATVSSFVFAVQMVNFSISGGTSGHLLGGVLAALILGPAEAMIVLSVVLSTQAFVFSDGGVFALGANIVNMALIGAVGGYYVFKFLRKITTNFSISVVLASWFSVVVASVFVAFEIAFSGTESLSAVLPAMVSYHIYIGIGEAAITLAILMFLNKNGFPIVALEDDDSEKNEG